MKYTLVIDKNAEEEIIARVHAPSELTARIENLVRSHSGIDAVMGYRDDALCRLEFSRIECITVVQRKVVAVDTQGREFFLKERLRDLEAVVPAYFVRINKSALANEQRIARFDPTFSGGVDAVFQCGFREYVSRRCFAQIRRRYEGK